MQNDPATYEVRCPFCSACHDFQTKKEADRLGNKLVSVGRLADMGRIYKARNAKPPKHTAEIRARLSAPAERNG